MMESYLITYTLKRGWKEKCVEMPSMAKLLAWIRANAARCRSISILVVRNNGEDKHG